MNLTSKDTIFSDNRVFLESQSIIKNVQCNICLNVYDDPALLSCNHTFCRKCICRWAQENRRKQCPLCKRNFQLNKLEKDVRIANIVNNLAVRCINGDCKWAGIVSAFRRHSKRCQHGLKKQKKRNVVYISDDEVREVDQMEFKMSKPPNFYTLTYYLVDKDQKK